MPFRNFTKPCTVAGTEHKAVILNLAGFAAPSAGFCLCLFPSLSAARQTSSSLCSDIFQV